VQEKPWQSALKSCYAVLIREMLSINTIMHMLVQEGLLTRVMQRQIMDTSPQLGDALRDHPDRNFKLIEHILDKPLDEGQATLCVLVRELLGTNQTHLAGLIANGLRIAWIRRDYIIDSGRGTSSTQMRTYLVNLETLLLNYAPDATFDPTYTFSSSTQQAIRNAWRTAELTKDHVTALLCQSFPLYNNFDCVDVYDENGAECYLYKNVQKRLEDDVQTI
jgi:hypothetical protein